MPSVPVESELLQFGLERLAPDDTLIATDDGVYSEQLVVQATEGVAHRQQCPRSRPGSSTPAQYPAAYARAELTEGMERAVPPVIPERVAVGTLGAAQMRVVLGHPAGEEEEDLDLRLEREDATVGDLLDALGNGINARGIVIDGRFCHVDLALSEIGLYEGARIRAAEGAPSLRQDAADDAALELRVIAGFDSGRRVPLRAGTGLVAGRDLDGDVVLTDDGVSGATSACEPSQGGLRATVTDLGSVNGTWVEGRRIKEPTDVQPETVFEAGDVAFTIAASQPRVPVDPCVRPAWPARSPSTGRRGLTPPRSPSR